MKNEFTEKIRRRYWSICTVHRNRFFERYRALDDYFAAMSDDPAGNASNPEYAAKLAELTTLLQESRAKRMSAASVYGDISDFHPAWEWYAKCNRSRKPCEVEPGDDTFQFSIEMDAGGKPFRVLAGGWLEDGDWESLWSADPNCSYTVLVPLELTSTSATGDTP